MERKTIGGFIATLRKANGMTQKELAERLNVSDKTVSRWERDDGAPDLSTIPVIAEIFDVTCDELLRGERKSPSERVEMPEENETSPKGEKQRQRLLRSTCSQYQNRTYIAMGISGGGLIAALICNLAFTQAVLGFLMGAIFFVGSIVCQTVFLNKAFLSVEDAGLEEKALSDYRRKVINLAEKSIGLTVLFIGFTFPMIMVNAYWGLEANSLLLWGTVSSAVFMIIYGVVLYFLNGSLLSKGIYSLADNELEKYNHNRKLKKKCSVCFTIILVVTLLFHAFGSGMIWSLENLELARAITFDDYDSFVAFMEQDVPDYKYYSDGFSTGVEIFGESESSSEWYDDEDMRCTVEDENGNVVCTYIQRNKSVSYITYSGQNGSVLPIKVVTGGAEQAAEGMFNLINAVYCILYPLELLAVLLVYFKKKAK